MQAAKSRKRETLKNKWPGFLPEQTVRKKIRFLKKRFINQMPQEEPDEHSNCFLKISLVQKKLKMNGGVEAVC